MSAIISALQLISPFYFPHLSFFHFACNPAPSLFLSLPFLFLSVSPGSPAEGSTCKSSRTIFFCTALISADDVSKEVKGTTQRPPQLFPPFTACRFMSLLALFLLSAPTPTRFLSHIFNIINIDRAVHLEPFYNNWLRSLILALMVSAGGWREKVGGC